MKKLLLSFCLLAACVTPVKILQLQQAVVKTADISTVSWLAKKNAECITLASKQAEQKEGMDTYATCTLDVFEKAQKIADLIDSIRQQHKTEAGVLLSIARGETTKEALKGITPEIAKQIDELTVLVGGLK